MEQFIFHCNTEYLSYTPPKRIFRKEKDFWYLLPKIINPARALENKDSYRNRDIKDGMDGVLLSKQNYCALHFHRQDEAPKLEMDELFRGALYEDFFEGTKVCAGDFQQVYGINPGRQEDFEAVRRFSKNANRLVICGGEDEACRELFDELL